MAVGSRTPAMTMSALASDMAADEASTSAVAASYTVATAELVIFCGGGRFRVLGGYFLHDALN